MLLFWGAWVADIGSRSSVRICFFHQGARGWRGQGSGSGEPSALSGQVTLNDPEIGRPRLPEEEHSITAAVCEEATSTCATTSPRDRVTTESRLTEEKQLHQFLLPRCRTQQSEKNRSVRCSLCLKEEISAAKFRINNHIPQKDHSK